MFCVLVKIKQASKAEQAKSNVAEPKLFDMLQVKYWQSSMLVKTLSHCQAKTLNIGKSLFTQFFMLDIQF